MVEKRLRASRREMSAALTLLPATVIDGAVVSSVSPTALLRLPHGVAVEFEGGSPSWIAELVREMAPLRAGDLRTRRAGPRRASSPVECLGRVRFCCRRRSAAGGGLLSSVARCQEV